MFFATVVFSALVSGVFCHGNRGILRQLEGGLNANTRLVLVYYAYDDLDLHDTRHEREYDTSTSITIIAMSATTNIISTTTNTTTPVYNY